jgi:DNA-binding MarR family transcriptional regulator
MPESSTRYDRYSLRILDVVETDRGVTQRSLARDMGIALGLTNLLIKRLVRKGWMRVTHISPNRVRYLITPAGIVEKSRMSRDYLEASVQFYRQARDRVKQRFLELSTTWPSEGHDGGKRIVFFGANEVAEIGYVCLVETDLRLVGVVDRERTGRFFDMPIASPDQLTGSALQGQPYDRVVVMSFGDTEPITEQLRQLDIPMSRVFWL